MLKNIYSSAIFLPALLMLSQATWAAHKVYSPIVEKGEVEFEVRWHETSDGDSSKDHKKKMKYEVGYGVTDWWFTSVFKEYEADAGESMHHSATAWENIFQLTEHGKYWADVGLYFEYEVAAITSDPDKMEFKVLLEKGIGRFTNTTNLIFEKKVGMHDDNDVEFGYAWRTKWRLMKIFEPAIEIYGETGRVIDFNSSEDQKHSIGPVASGEFKVGPGKIVYEAGYLFGISGAEPNNTVKLLLEYEFHF